MSWRRAIGSLCICQHGVLTFGYLATVGRFNRNSDDKNNTNAQCLLGVTHHAPLGSGQPSQAEPFEVEGWTRPVTVLSHRDH